MNDLPACISSADLVSGESTQIINDKLNKCMAKMNNWLLENKLIFN